jgi:hypothetical protein
MVRELDFIAFVLEDFGICFAFQFAKFYTVVSIFAALGNLDLNTLERVSHFDPDTAPPPRGQPKYGSRYAPFTHSGLLVWMSVCRIRFRILNSDSYCKMFGSKMLDRYFFLGLFKESQTPREAYSSREIFKA